MFITLQSVVAHAVSIMTFGTLGAISCAVVLLSASETGEFAIGECSISDELKRSDMHSGERFPSLPLCLMSGFLLITWPSLAGFSDEENLCRCPGSRSRPTGLLQGLLQE